MRLIKVTNVKPLPECKLDLAFSDGTQGTADLSGDLDGALGKLADPDVWKLAHVERGVVAWNDELDIAPEFLYARAHQLEPPERGEEVAVNQLTVTMRELRAVSGGGRGGDGCCAG